MPSYMFITLQLADSHLSNPFMNDHFERLLIRFDVFSSAQCDETAIFGEPLDKPERVFDLYPRNRAFLHLGSGVEDHLDLVFGAQVKGCEEVGRAKTRRVPLDRLPDIRADTEDDLSDQFDLTLERMI